MTIETRSRTRRKRRPAGAGFGSRGSKPTSRRRPAASGSAFPVYLGLVQRFPLISIRNESQLRAAQAVIDDLFGRGEPDAGTAMYLDALGDLVAAYEDAHHEIGPASDADLLRHLMEAKGVCQADIHKATGVPKSSISEVLSGKKPFTRSMIRAFAEYFGVGPVVLAGNLG